jgi:ribosomal protein S27E
MKLAEAIAIKARELGLRNMAVLPKLTEEERQERQKEWSRRHRRENTEKVREYHRKYYHATKKERPVDSPLPGFDGFYLTKCPDCGHTKTTAAMTSTQCQVCGKRFDPVTHMIETAPEVEA